MQESRGEKAYSWRHGHVADLHLIASAWIMCARSDAMPARNRKRVAAVVTIGVASASAAYYVYSK